MPPDETAMTDDCANVRFRLMLLRRGELDPAEAEAVRAHLADCRDCTAELEAERELDRRLADAKLAWSAPPELRNAAADLVAREGESPRRRWRRAAGRLVRRPLVAAALGAAATLLVVIAATLVASRARQPDPLAVPLAEVVAGYRRSALEQQIVRPGPDDLNRILIELQQRLGVPTTTAFRGDADLTLVAVDPTYALSRPGAILVFQDHQGQIVTLQIVRAPEVQIPRERGTPVGRFRPIITRQQDLSTALWKQGNAVYALSAPVDEAAMARIYLTVRLGTSNP
jgi:anti-sigma factor RsiW